MDRWPASIRATYEQHPTPFVAVLMAMCLMVTGGCAIYTVRHDTPHVQLGTVRPAKGQASKWKLRPAPPNYGSSTKYPNAPRTAGKPRPIPVPGPARPDASRAATVAATGTRPVSYPSRER